MPPKIMIFEKFKRVIGIGNLILLVSGTTMVAQSINATNNDLSPGQIFAKAQANYSSLASYSDEGRVVTTLNGVTFTTAFTIRLARANFYRVEWQQSSESEVTGNTEIQDAWSSGAGNFLEVGYGPQNEMTPDIALDEAACSSGRAAATVPMAFFNTQWGDELCDSEFEEVRQSDENIGGVDCFVLKKESQGQRKILWIGKQDFLIHQIQTEMSAEAMQALMARATRGNPEIITSLHSYISTETHTHIVVNRSFLRSDFIPSRPFFSSSNDGDN